MLLAAITHVLHPAIEHPPSKGENTAAAFLIGLGFGLPLLIWAASLRQTPFSRAFFWIALLYGGMVGGITWIIWISPHTGIGGVLGFLMPMLFIAALGAIFVEITATESGELRTWREEKRKRNRKQEPKDEGKWVTETVITNEDDDLHIIVRNDNYVMPVASLEPVSEMHHHADHIKSASALAENLNKAKVRVHSSALVRTK